MADTEELSRAEVWDDTALVESWDEAFAEYKKYHSLATRGERVVLKELRAAELVKRATEAADSTTTAPDNQSAMKPTTSEANHVADATRTQQAGGAGIGSQTVPSGASVPFTMPGSILANMQDEDLKNLMMSWYYAGYYTGLFEGKQQAYAHMQPPDS